MSAPRAPDHPIDPLFTNRWSPRAFAGTAIPQAALLSLLEGVVSENGKNRTLRPVWLAG